jgi:hypothetical protein
VKSPAQTLLLLALSCACFVAVAAQFEREGPRLIVVGALDIDGATRLAEHLADKAVRTVVFENSFGGTAEAGEAWAGVVRTAAVNTEITGQCHGACAIAFLAGKEHRFAAGLQVNGLLIPLGARSRAEAQKLLMAEFTFTGMSPREGWQPAQGLLFTSTPTLFGRVYNTFWCDGTQGRDTSKCEKISGVDPFKLGVLMELRP